MYDPEFKETEKGIYKIQIAGGWLHLKCTTIDCNSFLFRLYGVDEQKQPTQIICDMCENLINLQFIHKLITLYREKGGNITRGH